MALGLFAGLWLWAFVHFCIAVKTADKPAAKLALGLFVGLCGCGSSWTRAHTSPRPSLAVPVPV
jgi:hypothetical protein